MVYLDKNLQIRQNSHLFKIPGLNQLHVNDYRP
jgi:hypothetical protein